MKLVKPKVMKEWEAGIFSRYDIPSFLFMEQAGASLFRFIRDTLKLERNKKIAIVAGRGNNGGDGIVCARYLKEAGYKVTVFALFEKAPKGKDALLNFKFYRDTGGEVYHVSGPTFGSFSRSLSSYALIVDAILGIGIERKVEGLYKDVIEAINNTGIPVLSVDAPSGINLSNGKVLGIAVKASYTVTFGLPKIGLYVYPGRYFAGEVKVERVGFPEKDINEFPAEDFLIDKEMILSIFPYRLPWGHKGTFGKVLTIAGSRGLSGAAYLASLAALKAGAGLSYLVTPKGVEDQIKALTPEVITYPVEEKDGHIAYSAYDEIVEKSKEVDAVAIGPGLRRSEGIKRLVLEFVQNAERPVVLDADGINVISEVPEVLDNLKAHLILTPHPGELARLIESSPKEIDENRIDIAREFSLAHEDVVLALKGATTIVAKEGKLYYNITGNSGMATGGSGDVLTGIIAAFLGMGIDPLKSAVLGVYIHGSAGDMAASYKGEFGITATDLLAYLPYVLKSMEEEKL